MNFMNKDVDNYFTEGCGRCPHGGTPGCKVHNWPEELRLLRRIVLDCGLTEESKWGIPCYTFNKKNVAIVSAFREYCALSFFNGALISDSHKLLEKPGENSQAGRLIKFTDVQKIIELTSVLKAYIFEAIEIERAGLKVELKKTTDYAVPEEFQRKLDEIPLLKAAFEALTPGRQRAYLLHFAQPKQAKTREARIEKYLPLILDGKGLYDQ